MAISTKIYEMVEKPTIECTDKNCPYHGEISVRGRTFKGIVVSTKRAKTVKIKFELQRYDKKYERYEKLFTTIHAHQPPCIHLVDGDEIIIGETRPLSKTKHFVVLGKVKNNTL